MTEPIWLCILIAVAAYLTGSVSPAVWIARHWGGVNIRSVGSGNAGATNVLRTLGWVPAVVTFIADFLKGFLIAFLCARYLGRSLAYFAAAAAILGHAFPLFFHFRGGKCVATGIGAAIALFPLGGLAQGVFILILALSTRIVSISSIIGFALYPVVLFLLPKALLPDAFLPWFSMGVSLFVIWRHRTNIFRILAGEEQPMKVPKREAAVDK